MKNEQYTVTHNNTILGIFPNSAQAYTLALEILYSHNIVTKVSLIYTGEK